MAAAIIEQEGKVLLTRRKLHVHQGGLWEFPGGKQEANETLEACLQRELKEEIGVEVTDLTYFYTTCYRYSEKEVQLIFFTCSIYQGIPRALDCLELAWVSKLDLPFYDFPPADRPVLSKLLGGDSMDSIH